jgi:hypothetical protein
MLEAVKVAKLGGYRQKSVFWFLAIASVSAIALAFWFYLARDYRLGSPVRSLDGVGFTQSALGERKGPDPMGMGMTGVGFAIVTGLDWIRLRFAGFPLHPIGYVLGMSYGIDYYWFGLALALGLKTFAQRYFSSAGYDKLRAAILGIMVAEYAAEAMWMTISLITKQSTYTIGFEDRSLGLQ